MNVQAVARFGVPRRNISDLAPGAILAEIQSRELGSKQWVAPEAVAPEAQLVRKELPRMSYGKLVLVDDESLAQRIEPVLKRHGLDGKASASAGGLLHIRRVDATEGDVSGDARVVRVWGRERRAARVNPFEGNVHAVIGEQPLDLLDVETAVGHFLSGDTVELSELIGESPTWETRLRTSSGDKAELLDELMAFAQREGLRRRFREDMALALDELYSNAIYNAPVENGVALFAEQDRGTEVVSPRPVSVRWGTSKHYAFIAVKDEYGSLSPVDFLKALGRCYGGQRAVPSDKRGGAGLGTFMVLEKATRLIVNLRVGHSTEFIFLRRADQKQKEFAHTAPSFHLCVAGDQWPTPRRSKRVFVCVPGLLGEKHQSSSVVLRNLSQHGVLLAWPPNLPDPKHDETIQIQLMTGQTERVHRYPAVVRWYDPKIRLVGVEFVEPIPQDVVEACRDPRETSAP